MRLFFLLVFLLFSCPSQAQENKAYLKDGQIVVETDNGTHTVDYSRKNPYQKVSAEKWNVKEKIDPVHEAMKVYQKKDSPLYQKRIWIINKKNKKDQIIVEFVTENKDATVLFSSDEKYVYYMGMSEKGIRNVYGYQLLNHRKFVVGQASAFQLLPCGNNVSYIILKNEGDDLTYFIYDMHGKKKDTLFNVENVESVSKNLCP